MERDVDSLNTPFFTHLNFWWRDEIRKTRIAFSVICGVLSLLLIGLWIRSYWWRDWITVPLPHSSFVNVWSVQGKFCFGTLNRNLPWTLESMRVPPNWQPTYLTQFEDGDIPNPHSSCFPQWVVTSAFATLMAISWLPRRFSLKALLIFTTFLSLALGLIIYLTKQ